MIGTLAARGTDVGPGIAHHYSAARLAAGAADGKPQHLRVGFLRAESVLSADRREIAAEVQGIEEPYRQPFKLIGADREPKAVGRKPVKDVIELRERARMVGYMRGIMVDENAKNPIEVAGCWMPALGQQGAFDHAARAAPDQPPRIVLSDRRQALAGQHEIERRN